MLGRKTVDSLSLLGWKVKKGLAARKLDGKFSRNRLVRVLNVLLEVDVEMCQCGGYKPRTREFSVARFLDWRMSWPHGCPRHVTSFFSSAKSALGRATLFEGNLQIDIFRDIEATNTVPITLSSSRYAGGSTWTL